MTDWPTIHADVAGQFAAAWTPLDLDAWDKFLAEDVVAVQPLLPECRSRTAWQSEVRRVVALMPDLRGDVQSWVGSDDLLFIEMTLSATLAGKPFAFTAVEKLYLTSDARVIRRESYFDPLPLAQALLLRPSSWLPWWRSGAGPLTSRRRFTRAI